MTDEPKPEDEVPEVEQEAQAEAKPGKKAKSAKKKAAEPQADEVQAEAMPAEETPAESEVPVVETGTAEASPSASIGDEAFAQGVQSLLRAEYDAADNYFGQVLTNSRKNGDQAGQVAALEQLGHLNFLRGAEAQAQDYYQQARQLRGT